MSQTYFHVSKGVRAIDVLLYLQILGANKKAAYLEPPHQDLRCLQIQLFQFCALKVKLTCEKLYFII